MEQIERQETFRDSVIKIAVPVTAQCLIQASFSVVDQIMTGQMGSVSVAGIGLAGKFAGFYGVAIAAVAAAGSILFAQYIGKNDRNGINTAFGLTMLVNTLLGLLFLIPGLIFPMKVMSWYSGEIDTVTVAGEYLFIVALVFLPMAWSNILSALFRCRGQAGFPLYASLASAAVNTLFNYLLIFGKAGFPALGVKGAAIATLLGRCLELLFLILFFVRNRAEWKSGSVEEAGAKQTGSVSRTFVTVLTPILINELLWGLGENIYAVIYGHIGTAACAAMTLTNPIQSLTIGALTGISSAAGIIIGRRLGEGNRERAYLDSRKFMLLGLAGSVILAAVILIGNGWYLQVYKVDEQVKLLTRYLLVVYAFIAPVKVENMILGGGILRSGGKTRIVLIIDLIGTWCIGVPLGLFTAFVLKMPVHLVYLILSMEECVRFIIGLVIFKRKKWMCEL